MDRKTQLFLGLFTVALVVTTIFPINSLVSASVPAKAPISVLAQRQRSRASDIQQITKAVLQDNQPISPQAPVKVDEVKIVNSYAIAIVLIGEHGGGMSVLQKKQGIWQVIGGGGGAVDEKYLVELGVPSSTAQQLIGQI